jgi:hypothetical protein
MQRQVRRLSDPLDDEGAVRIKQGVSEVLCKGFL